MFEIRLEDECIYVGDEKSCRYIANMVYEYYKNDKPIPSITIINQDDILNKKKKICTQQNYIEKYVCVVAKCYIDEKTSENIFINCKLNENDTLFNIEWVIDNLESDENILSYYIINDHNQLLNFYDIFSNIYKHNYKKIK
jgi:hypothetical protein